MALGGTPFGGGRGGMLGSILGAACIFLIQDLLSALDVSVFYLNIVYGGLLLFGACSPRRSPCCGRPAAGGRRHELSRASRFATRREGSTCERSGRGVQHRRALGARFMALQERVPILQVLAIAAASSSTAASTIDGFAQRRASRDAACSASLLGIAALGQTLVVLLGDLDLSVRR